MKIITNLAVAGAAVMGMAAWLFAGDTNPGTAELPFKMIGNACAATRGTTNAAWSTFDFRSPEAPKFSAKTSLWNFQFTGAKANIVELARWYAAHCEANFDAIVKGRWFRELDPMLGAYAVLFGDTGDKVFAGRYRDLMLKIARQGWLLEKHDWDPCTGNDLMASYVWMRDKGVFTEDEQKVVESWMLKLKGFLQFWAQESNYGRLPQLAKAIERHYPEEAQAIMKEFPTNSYCSYVRYPRCQNDSFGYNRVWLKNTYLYAKTVRPDLIGNANHRAAAEWFLAQWTPNGLPPCYGDMNASLWDANLPEWLAAHALKDGRLKWVAIKIMQYALRHDLLRELGSQPACFRLWSVADDALKPVAPQIGSAVLKWKGGQGDKMVFRAGWQDDDAYVLLNLLNGYGHDDPWHSHADQNAVVLLEWQGRPWVVDSNYGIQDILNHNVLTVDRLRPSGASQISCFRDFGPCAVGGSLVENYLASTFDWERVVIFSGDGDVAILDGVLAKGTGKHDLNVLWHVKGELTPPTGSAFAIRQGDASLRMVCSTDAAVAPWRMANPPDWDNPDNSSPPVPESYDLYWGQPCSQLSLPAPSREWVAGQRASWITFFSPADIGAVTWIKEWTHAGLAASSGGTVRICGARFASSAVYRYGTVETDAKAFSFRKSGTSTRVAAQNAGCLRMGDLDLILSPVAEMQPAPDAWVELSGSQGQCRVWAPCKTRLSLTVGKRKFAAVMDNDRIVTFEVRS